MHEYGINDLPEPIEQDSIVRVRDETPQLLWRSIVQGFGWAVGLFLAFVLLWLLLALFLTLIFHQAVPFIRAA